MFLEIAGMNFLAHLFLTRHHEALMVGNFLGDFLQNRDLPAYPEQVRRGVRLHRRIDSFTDRHPLVLRGARRLYPRHHKYAPVIIDIFYDYLLAYNWQRYSDRTLRAFTNDVYAVLQAHRPLMAPRMQRQLDQMVADDWLLQYTHLDGIGDTFLRLKRRVSRPEDIDGAVDSLKRDFGELLPEFNGFFPEVQQLVAAFV